ncbi:MAG TPA: hypothetical protein VF219_14165 [Vicinamibacterales bacterium]
MKVVWAAAAAIVALACGSHPPSPPHTANEIVVWKEVGSWSGSGNFQSESFTSDTGGFRVRWETKNERVPGAGRMKVVFRSGDSGRPIIEAVDVKGVGRNVQEVADNVRWYYLTIESANVEWSVSVDERLRGVKRP